jgi:MFS family permease
VSEPRGPVPGATPGETGELPGVSYGGSFGALRHRDFRLLWSGSIIANIGNWMQQVAQAWLIYDLTGSPFLVGLGGLLRTVPFLVMSLYAGTVVDRVDRRKLLFWVECGNLAITVYLTLVIASGQVQVWHIYFASVLTAMVGSFENPSYQAILPDLVPRRDLMTAVSLNSLLRRGSQIIGPALGGVSVAILGVTETYVINDVGYVVLIVLILVMRPGRAPAVERARSPLQAISDGLAYVRQDRLIAGLLVIDAATSIFGHAYNGLLVIFARDVFDSGAQGLGLLQSAPGLGTVIGSVVLATLGDVDRKGRFMMVGGVAFAFAIILFALVPSFPLALVFLAISGVADVTMGSLRTTILQFVARREMLGRVMSLQSMATRGVGGLGSFQAGAIGSLIGVPYAIALGGLVVLGAILAVGLAVPPIRQFTGTGRAGRS